jgi:hypothetical protein
MRISRTTVLVLAFSAASLCVSGKLLADVATWTLTDTELLGGAMITGSFQYDSATQKLLNYNFNVPYDCYPLLSVGGLTNCLDGASFSPMPYPNCVQMLENPGPTSFCTSSVYDLSASGFGVSDESPPDFPALVFTFSSPLNPSQGAIPFSVEYYNVATVEGAYSNGGTGYATPSTPEPRLTFIIVVIFAGILAAKLRARVRTSGTQQAKRFSGA